jgi:hypothetical protein
MNAGRDLSTVTGIIIVVHAECAQNQWITGKTDNSEPAKHPERPQVVAEAGQLQEKGLTFTWTAGQASALDTRSIGAGKDVGNVRVKDAQGQDVPHDILFAFAFHAFWPEGHWMLGAGR